MKAIIPSLEDEGMGSDGLSLTLEGDVSLLPAFGHPGTKERRGTGHSV